MRTLKERLPNWTEWDIAEYHLGVVLGYFEDVNGGPSGDWNGHKGTIWTDTPVGSALHAGLQGLVSAGSLLFDENLDSYRWNDGVAEAASS